MQTSHWGKYSEHIHECRRILFVTQKTGKLADITQLKGKALQTTLVSPLSFALKVPDNQQSPNTGPEFTHCLKQHVLGLFAFLLNRISF